MSSAAPLSVSDLPPLRFSVLQKMSRSAAHARYALEHPDAGATPAMRFGTLVHAVVLGTPLPGPVWSGERRGKAWLDFKEANDGAEIITQDELNRATEIAMHVVADPEAAEALDGIREERVLFTMCGRDCRVTPDVRSRIKLTELKTTANASPKDFPWHSLRQGYLAQLAWQQDGLRAAGLPVPDLVRVVAVEIREPFAVCVFGVTPDALEFGRRCYRTWLEAFLNCERSNVWPSYGPGVLDAPPEDFRLEGLDEEEASNG